MTLADDDENDVQCDIKSISIIAKPLALGKIHGHIMKLVKKSAKGKTLKRGVKEVVKAIRKGSKGIVIMAGDISPIDVLTHIPVLCEDANILYAFVPSKAALGVAGSTRRPTCCVLIPLPKKGEDEISKYFEKCTSGIKAISS
jgi:H/ACA ribonucleoprotein complex subunit 2